jgi:hypothetical protein
MSDQTTTLFRPVGPQELALIVELAELNRNIVGRLEVVAEFKNPDK